MDDQPNDRSKIQTEERMISWDRFSKADPTLPRFGSDLTTRESRISKSRDLRAIVGFENYRGETREA